MSFNTSLSGLNAASSDLDVVSNNIANANTTGFKRSRAEFADIFAVSSFGSPKTAVGSGVLLNRAAQQFDQGNLDFTQNILDLAVSGRGFFALSPNLTNNELVYSRAGAFSINKDGYVVNGAGQFLRTYPVNQDGTVTASSLESSQPVRLPTSAGTPQATSQVSIGANLPADAASLDPANFDPLDADTFTASTSTTVFDSLGNSHISTLYFVKDTNSPNQWAVYNALDGALVNVSGGTAGAGGIQYGTLNFDSSGGLMGTTPSPLVTDPIVLGNGANDMTLTLNFPSTNTTQVASPFNVTALDQDGFTSGRLTGLDISETGVIRANFSNGQNLALGKVALAQFPNEQGLRQLGNNSWAGTIDSGAAIAGEAGNGSFGLIQGGALESSNVDLTAELVHLITAQRNFQANARAIETASTLTDSILNIR
ncbi:flagellar basal body FlaE domain protein [Nitrosococcus halophilus Nc 4]|uniref:Flagellar hook protein FlgE n=1 Tax=Nitrosococcus halophilus (strain Nc4) TaxID=472759 RepID=D5BV65_NITHN|nr:flagellar hook protein FlgE [Nitrosococcus halophilus]ADE15415.1 flagellar basal body FlaE domain protein [Nitrosococcus halophilus Nc 4]